MLAIINSDTLYKAVTPLMSKGQFGPRDLHKHLWKLPIPNFDSRNKVHTAVARSGEAATDGVARQLAKLRRERGDVGFKVTRGELRGWLEESKEGKVVEKAVSKLLSG